MRATLTSCCHPHTSAPEYASTLIISALDQASARDHALDHALHPQASARDHALDHALHPQAFARDHVLNSHYLGAGSRPPPHNATLIPPRQTAPSQIRADWCPKQVGQAT